MRHSARLATLLKMPDQEIAVTSLSAIAGIGPQRAALLAKLGLVTHEDLLHFVPRRYEDRRHLTPLSEAQAGQAMTVRGRVHATKTMRWGKMRVAEAVIAPERPEKKDDIIVARWYGYWSPPMKEGAEVFLYGALSREKKGHWLIAQPDYEIIQHDAEDYIHIDRIAPIYNLTEGLTQRILRRIMFEASQKASFHAPEFYPAPGEMMSRQEGVPGDSFSRVVGSRA